ncbi:LacI family DNA-binding transcriptional regulator [Peribacillus sp. TH14]|uniref:LacI family DNA-binding transcriptional regulator n=1 Tax=Peribacillus sp. TH14 TaxID=2798481 RepID=UPI001914B3B9|nr:LacI family DNA-binding transcriptional regulator [Peribacillus sp. TH14]MBK5502229.1 LacI family DNA-binding transcriptional regulator [Peribacillus sp. TH14]
MATIKDVAREAKVSISTVSRVLNMSGYTSEKTKEKVLNAVKKLDYKGSLLAAAMIKKQTLTLGLIIPDIKNIFHSDLTRAVEDGANSHGFNIFLCNTDNNLQKEAEYIHLLIAKGVDGIIFSSPEVKDKNIKEVKEKFPELPIVILGSKFHTLTVNEILVDNFDGGYNATSHLLELGHKDIAFISGGIDSYSSIQRHKGYKFALNESGIPINDDFVIFDRFYIESGYKNALKLLQKSKRPTAIFAGSDSIAVGIYKAARELNIKIPEQLSIVGFDDSQYAEILSPMLTTIHIPIKEMGQRAIEIIVKSIKEKQIFKETLVLYPTFIERESTMAVHSK